MKSAINKFAVILNGIACVGRQKTELFRKNASRDKNIHIFLSAVLSLNTFDIGIMGCEKQSHGAVEFKAEANT